MTDAEKHAKNIQMVEEEVQAALDAHRQSVGLIQVVPIEGFEDIPITQPRYRVEFFAVKEMDASAKTLINKVVSNQKDGTPFWVVSELADQLSISGYFPETLAGDVEFKAASNLMRNELVVPWYTALIRQKRSVN